MAVGVIVAILAVVVVVALIVLAIVLPGRGGSRSRATTYQDLGHQAQNMRNDSGGTSFLI